MTRGRFSCACGLLDRIIGARCRQFEHHVTGPDRDVAAPAPDVDWPVEGHVADRAVPGYANDDPLRTCEDVLEGPPERGVRAELANGRRRRTHLRGWRRGWLGRRRTRGCATPGPNGGRRGHWRRGRTRRPPAARLFQ